MAHRPTLLTMNGHPDDETVTAGGAMARYAAAGVRVVCVVATRGERGEIVAPDLDTPENLARLGEIREGELRGALAALGSIDCRILGYRDSGTAGTAGNNDPRAFAQADPLEAAGRLAQIVREVQADVIVAPNEWGGDGHPDHIQASRIARIAFDRAGDPSAWPEQLEGSGLQAWTPLKLYEPFNQFGRRAKLLRALRTGGIRGMPSMILRVARHWSPRRERQRARMAAAQGHVTTRVDVAAFLDAKYTAMRRHRTQIAAAADLFALSVDERRRVSPTEDYTLRESRVPIELPEDDLFNGLARVGQQRSEEAGGSARSGELAGTGLR